MAGKFLFFIIMFGMEWMRGWKGSVRCLSGWTSGLRSWKINHTNFESTELNTLCVTFIFNTSFLFFLLLTLERLFKQHVQAVITCTSNFQQQLTKVKVSDNKNYYYRNCIFVYLHSGCTLYNIVVVCCCCFLFLIWGPSRGWVRVNDKVKRNWIKLCKTTRMKTGYLN